MSRAISRNACSAIGSSPSWNMNAGTPSSPSSPAARAEIVDGFFHGVADEHQRLHLLALRSRGGHAPAPCRSGCGRRGSRSSPSASASRSRRDTQREARHSRKPAVIDQLHVEPADRRRLAEHVGLQPAGRVPQRLAAHGGVERERSAGRAGRTAPSGRAPSPASGTHRSRCDGTSQPVSPGVRWTAGSDRGGHRPWAESVRTFAPIKWPRRRQGAIAGPRPDRGCAYSVDARMSCSSSGWSRAANHSARAAARRWPRSSSGSLSDSSSASTSCARGHVRQARPRAERRLVERRRARSARAGRTRG